MDLIIGILFVFGFGFVVMKLNLNKTLVARVLSFIVAIIGSMLINYLFLANFFNSTGISKKDTILNQVIFYGILVFIIYALYVITNVAFTKVQKQMRHK